MNRIILAAWLVVGGSVGVAPVVYSLTTAPSLSECVALAGPTGKFATYNKAADARCDGHMETWSSLRR
jgi:hypothetical protein